MTAADVAAVLVAAAGLVTAVTALVHSIRTRSAVIPQVRAQSREPRGD